MFGSSVYANGLLIPEDKKLPPLVMVSHKVVTDIHEQVVTTMVEQVFRNHTDRPLEASYVFPVPKGASVNKFIMWVDGQETIGELLDAKTASQVYTDIVRRTQDPGLLEYLGNDLLRLRIFPVPPKGDQKVKLSFTEVAQQDNGVVQYVYPMKTDGKATRTLDDFSITVLIRSEHPILAVYSPTHTVAVSRKSAREVRVDFEKNQALLDKDFELFYSLGNQQIGLTPFYYRPVSSEDGYFLLLLSPNVTATTETRIPRDLVLVLDTSGSMSQVKMDQAKKALNFCLSRLSPEDRFAVISFATTVRSYRDELLPVADEHIEQATKWVNDLKAGGGTAILPALNAALNMRSQDEGRSFTIVFFTDGMPTVDETNPEKIVQFIEAKNTGNTRIFTFGVGDDVNAAMLDRLADVTKAISTYVRPEEDIEAKASSLYTKISHPVMTNLRLSTTNVSFHEVYPPQLPDLFHGSQLVVIGRFAGQGTATVKLDGLIGKEKRELIYDLNFPSQTEDGKNFVEHLWARRKVGYLLDQIRANGEQKELVEEVISFARKYGIATPYTSYLVVPDTPLPVAQAGRSLHYHTLGFNGALSLLTGGPAASGHAGNMPTRFASGQSETANLPMSMKAADIAKAAIQEAKTDREKIEALGKTRAGVQKRILADELRNMEPEARKGVYAEAIQKAGKDMQVLDQAKRRWMEGNWQANQIGQQEVDLALTANTLRNQEKLTLSAYRSVNGRYCINIGGVWIDDAFDAEMKTVQVKSLSEAYFRILDRQPNMKSVYMLGNHIVWVTPSNTALIIDLNEGHEKLTDEEIDRLFTVNK
jgi:Ca-activated chloride channel family protein